MPPDLGEGPPCRAPPTHACHQRLSPSDPLRAVTICAAGTGSATTAATAACNPCALGYYGAGGTVALPKSACTLCPGGNTTAVTGATSAAQCQREGRSVPG